MVLSMAKKSASGRQSGRGKSGAAPGELGDDLEALSFEQLLERLEEVVESLEQGDAPLEQALATFERGVRLSRLGGARLDEAERRIEVLLRDGRTQPLPSDESALDEAHDEALHDDR